MKQVCASDIQEAYNSKVERTMVIEMFDTHEYVKKLTDAGIPNAQAEAFSSLKLDIVDLSNRMDLRFVELEERLLKWLFGFFVTNMAATFAMVKYLAG